MSGPRKKITANRMILNGGYRNFRAALRYASRVGQYCGVYGKSPSVKEYQEFHGLSQAQAYRDLQSWKRCVPEYSVLEVVSTKALADRGLSEDDREELIARQLADG